MDNAEITRLLQEVRSGKSEAQSRLACLVYDDLHRLAARCMSGERADHSLQATVLVHEAFIRLVSQEEQSWQNRAHFFAAAAQVMRRILIDYARAHRSEKRGGGRAKVQLEDAFGVSDENYDDWILVDQALTRLAERDTRLARTVELRFFAGLTEDEIGEVLGVSPRTVKRDWRVAKAWLYGELSSIKANDSAPVAARPGNHG
jgi:RNA polymerase sigma-70 factor (ECF subfamily)